MSAGFQCLTCLESSVIDGCTEVEVEGLHEALQHMTALKDLYLRNLPNLESLPDCFGNLPLLSGLSIKNCSKLACLPTSLSLSRLKILGIWDCPELEKRCQKKTGEDWPKIAHIRDIRMPFSIDGEYYDSSAAFRWYNISGVVFEVPNMVKKEEGFGEYMSFYADF
ncbi:putative disease resistance protein RGA4 [Spatholobus suberectus]|nr:putative disease resistance protein RGA4 [Spatholobus suberectus]